MKKPEMIALINGIIIIVSSLILFFILPNQLILSIINALTGILMIGSYNGIKKEDKIISHVIVIITLIAAILNLVLALNSNKFPEELSRNISFSFYSLMSIASFLSIVFYVARFISISKKKRKELAEN